MSKIVFFGRSNWQYNGFDSMKILLNDVVHDSNFYYVTPMEGIAFNWLNFFYMSRIGTAIEKRVSIPLRSQAFKKYLQCSGELEAKDEIYFVFVRFEPWFFGDKGFLCYLKNRYPNSTLVYLLINVNRYLGIDFDIFCPCFDRVITIDEGDAQKYGLEFHPFFYSSIDTEDPSIPESDCFYVGNAKGRLDEILSVYELLVANGLECDFHIVGVPEEKQKYKESITYNRPMNYDEVVCRTKKSKLLLEIMQDGQTSGTLREHEAVVYGKKLLTNNRYITNRSFYIPQNISVFENVEAIDTDFIKDINSVEEYPCKELISPRALLEFLQK